MPNFASRNQSAAGCRGTGFRTGSILPGGQSTGRRRLSLLGPAARIIARVPAKAKTRLPIMKRGVCFIEASSLGETFELESIRKVRSGIWAIEVRRGTRERVPRRASMVICGQKLSG